MNILYIAISFPKENEGGNLYTDLAEELAKKHNVTVLVTEEKKNIEQTKIGTERNMEVIRTKVGNLYNVSFIEKAISFLTLPYFVKRSIKKLLKDRKYDMVLYTAPPVTIRAIIKYAKKKFKCMAYLMQKDIFPQNAVDIGIMKKNSLPYFYFRNEERKLYKVSDKIGCMSQGNMEYIKKENANIKNLNEKINFFPNTITIKENVKQEQSNIKEKYHVPENKVIALYGGNFGKPQGIDFIIKVVEAYKKDDSVFFVFIGKGTEKQKLFNYIKENNIQNVLALEYIPREEYSELLKIADIGLIFLDNRFTIPNIPSRLLSYLEYGIPVLAATDKNTDLSNILEENNIGKWCESDKVEDFIEKMNWYVKNKEARIQIGENGRKYLENNWTTKKSVIILEEVYQELKKEEKANV